LRHLRLDVKKKTVEFDGVFCIGDCPLELLICQNEAQAYESLISSPCKPSDLHLALLALGLKPHERDEKDEGKILREGDPVDLSLRYARDGKTVTVEPRELILNARTKKHIDATAWVFYGSILYPEFRDQPSRRIYLADAEKRIIGLIGEMVSVIDISRSSAMQYGDLAIDTQAAPPKGTKVTVIVRPARDRKPPAGPRPDPPVPE
jgi:hypothetical protein